MLIRNPFFRWLRSEFGNFRLKSKHEGLTLGSSVRITNSNLGRFNLLCDGSSLSHVTLGDYSYAGLSTRISRADIGKFCSIGPNVIIGLGIHPTDFVSTHPIFYSNTFPTKKRFTTKSFFKEHQEVKIGHDVWIGANCVILDGVTIGNGAIIAAGAIVNKDVEPYSIIGGVPAKLIKMRFDQSDIEFLETAKWWDRDLQWLNDNFQDFHDIERARELLEQDVT